MPRWQKNKDGRDRAAFSLRVELSRVEYQIIREYIRDNRDEGWSDRQAIMNALKIGLEELGETYDPRKRQL